MCVDGMDLKVTNIRPPIPRTSTLSYITDKKIVLKQHTYKDLSYPLTINNQGSKFNHPRDESHLSETIKRLDRELVKDKNNNAFLQCDQTRLVPKFLIPHAQDEATSHHNIAPPDQNVLRYSRR